MSVRARLRFACLTFVAVAAFSANASVSVTDDAGNEVTLAQPAERVIALSPHLTEVMFEIGAGAKLVGVTAYSDYPPEALQIEQIGDAFRVDYERVVALKPDLVLIWGSGNAARTMERLTALDIPAFISEPRRLQQVRDTFIRIGMLVDRQTAAQRVSEAFEARWQSLSERGKELPATRAFIQLDASPLYTVNGDHLISEALALCNVRNVFADLATLAPTVSIEAVIAEDPDLIVASDAIPTALFPGRWREFGQMKINQGNGYLRIDPSLMHRQTSRILDGAQTVCDFIAHEHRRSETSH